ncbi:MAG: PTS sugar transporter subunit IIA [Candidatus Zixiibacteriota bacterium]
MNISRLLDASLIELAMSTRIVEDPDNPVKSARRRRLDQETILDELVSILERSGKVGNRSKLLVEFINRERKAPTAIGYGIAIPHVRTYQVRELVIGVGRSAEGYDFGAPDDEPVRLFFVMAAPSYDDNLYLRVFKSLAEVLQFDYFRQRLMETNSVFEIIRTFEEME